MRRADVNEIHSFCVANRLLGLREGVGDFNADGKLDLVVAHPADNGDSIECVELGDRSWRCPLQGRITEDVALPTILVTSTHP